MSDRNKTKWNKVWNQSKSFPKELKGPLVSKLRLKWCPDVLLRTLARPGIDIKSIHRVRSSKISREASRRPGNSRKFWCPFAGVDQNYLPNLTPPAKCLLIGKAMKRASLNNVSGICEKHACGRPKLRLVWWRQRALDSLNVSIFFWPCQNMFWSCAERSTKPQTPAA